jgi:hypothetical protein
MVEHNEATNKWAVHFVTFRVTEMGDAPVVGRVTSAAVFDNKQAAYAGGARAVALLEKTGAFPNLCGPF